MITPRFAGQAAVILGTGPSLAAARPALIAARRARRCRLIGMNNTYRDFPDLDAFTACDPAWWEIYGQDFRARHPRLPAWHWEASVAAKFHVEHLPGRWADGLSTDPRYIHYGHSSGYQAIGIARHLGCDPILLAGYDMHYPEGKPRHYFDGLSETTGEYPGPLRKFSTFDGLLACYRTIAEQADRPTILNITPGSAMHDFPFATLDEALDGNYHPHA